MESLASSSYQRSQELDKLLFFNFYLLIALVTSMTSNNGLYKYGGYSE